MKQRTVDISGFRAIDDRGVEYEDACQRMLWRGVEYLEERKPPVSMWAGAYDNLDANIEARTQNSDMRALEAVMLRDEKDITTTMYGAVLGHLAYIHTHGVDNWLAALAEAGREVWLWEGDLGTAVPQQMEASYGDGGGE